MTDAPKPSCPTAPVLAIARALVTDAGQAWSDIKPEQWESDVQQSRWMLKIIDMAGFTIVPTAAAA